MRQQLGCHRCALPLCACLFVLLHATAKADLIAISGAGQGTASALYKVDPLTGAAWKIGDTGLNNIKGIAIHPLTNQLLAHRNNPGTDAGDLYTLDFGTTFPTTIGVTHIGATHLSASDLTFSSDGTLYGWMEFHETLNVTDNLVTFSQTTGQATFVTNAQQDTNRSGLAFDRNEMLHLKSGGDSQIDGKPRLFTVNPTTGAVTPGAEITGHDPTNTLDFDPNNVAYTVERKLELQPNNSLRHIGTFLQTIDITTGAVTEIGVIRTADGSLPQISAIAFTSFQITAVPEPSSCLLLGLMSLGTTVILARRRQTRRIVSPD